jgi:HAE1 family hydrophobic/amphiphilic exporter-1
LRRSLSSVAGLKSFIVPIQSLRFGGRSTQSQYQVVLKSLNADETRAWSAKLENAMKADSGTFIDVASDLENNALQADIKVNNDRANALGVTTSAIRNTLEAAFGTLTATQIQTTGNSYSVILELDQSRNWDETQLASLRVPSTSGKLIPLGSFSTVSRSSGPITVNQTGQLTAVTLSYNLPEGVSLGTATARLDQLRANIGMPATVTTELAGAAQVFKQSTGNTPLLIATAILTIYVVLGVLYESFAHPFTILSGLPSAALGALLALKLWGLDFSIVALIGLLMLIGIVKKNAIMMIDVALTLMREENMEPGRAIHIAAVRRFRPIMMTTFCALLAAVPVALSSGPGSELRQPLGVAVVGGLLISQVLTLFITPVIFTQVQWISEKLAFRKKPPEQVQAAE